MTFPDFVNSMLFLPEPVVLRAELFTRSEFADENWRGRQGSDSDSEMLVLYAASSSVMAAAAFSETSVTDMSEQFQKAKATASVNRYFRSFFI